MRTLPILLLLTAGLFQFCDNKSKLKTAQTKQQAAVETEKLEHNRINRIDSADKELLQSLPIMEVPLIDSTNFDNFERIGVPDNGFLKRAGLKTSEAEAKNFRLNYHIPFSTSFATVAITYQSGDHELFTALLTLDNQRKVIDRLVIAYDEIAESAFRKTSEIQNDIVVVTSANWMEAAPVYEFETYVLQPDGTFKKLILRR